jgi:hypothetical protein
VWPCSPTHEHQGAHATHMSIPMPPKGMPPPHLPPHPIPSKRLHELSPAESAPPPAPLSAAPPPHCAPA